MKTEVEIRVRQRQGGQQPPKARKDKEQIVPQSLGRERSLANMFTLGFWLTRLKENKSLFP